MGKWVGEGTKKEKKNPSIRDGYALASLTGVVVDVMLIF